MTPNLKDTLLLVGDNSARRVLHSIFESGYYLLEAEDAEQGSFMLGLNGHCITAVIADIPLEQADMRRLVEASKAPEVGNIPVIFLLDPNSTEFDEEAIFCLGASDVVHKPYANITIQRRVQILVDLHNRQWHLESEILEKNNVIHATYLTMLDTLSAIIEYRDVDSGNHALRIRGLTRLLLEEVAAYCPEYGLDETAIDTISNAASLHDIGKISIPDSILKKPGALTPEEIAIIRTHTTVGADLITRLEAAGNITYLQYAYNICLYHHERWDGAGYPNGLRGDEIPICAQVVGLIDAFDALTSTRCYKPALAYETAVNMLCNGECGLFSPKLLECFKQVCGELIRFARTYADMAFPTEGNVAVPLTNLEPKPRAADGQQTSYLKYRTLLHYINDTVIELDIDNRVYHVVYNPNPDFISLLHNADFDELTARMMERGVHPQDVQSVLQMQKEFSRQLFVENQPRCSFRCRIFNPPCNTYHPYEVTLLRIQADSAGPRLLVAVFHNLSDSLPTAPEQKPALPTTPALYDLTNAALRCRADKALTILDGAGSLLPLTGYTAQELETSLTGSLLELLESEDHQAITDAVRRSSEDGTRQEVQLRLRRKNADPLWVLCRLRVTTDSLGLADCYCTLTDITSVRSELQQLGRDYIRNRTIVNQFKSIIFEWNLQTDEFFCSPQWEERFGYPFTGIHFRKIMTGQNYIHPDDLPQLRDIFRRLIEKEGKDYMDLRIADSTGQYQWSRIRAVSKTENAARPTCIIGVIYDIHDLKKDMLSMQQKVQQDALTKLLNKESVEHEVTEYLAARKPEEKAAVLILDLDNFKEINDTYGHLYGDTVLMQIGANLRSFFRTRDVIGRIGGDEFLVLLKNIPNTEVVRDRCELLVNNFRDYLHGLMPKLNVSVSVGCVMLPEYGTTWAEAYKHADIALYASKNKGKCQYTLYSPADNLARVSMQMTRIDSDEQTVVSDEAFMRFAFHSLYTSRDIGETIQMLLAHIGTRFNVSRVYIFENNEENTHCNNTFEWCNVGITPQIDFLQNVSYETDAPNWPSYFNEDGVVYCTDTRKLPPEIRQILEPQGIKSMLHCAIMYDGVFRGYVGFDECNTSYMWTQAQIALLQFIAEILAVFLYRYRYPTPPRDALPTQKLPTAEAAPSVL